MFIIKLGSWTKPKNANERYFIIFTLETIQKL